MGWGGMPGSAEERSYQALKIAWYWGDTMWDLSGNQRNTLVPSRSPPHQQPQVLQGAPFRNSFPAIPCSLDAPPSKPDDSSPTSSQLQPALSPTHPHNVEWVSLASKGRPWHLPKGPASLPPPAPALDEDQLGEATAGGCWIGGVDLEMTHTPPPPRGEKGAGG